jgi:hypothetical protein
MTRTRCCCALIVLLSTCDQSSAKGGSYHMEDRYNPQHIESLPSEVRNSILHGCAEPKALHPFASYFDKSKLLRTSWRLSISGIEHQDRKLRGE